MISHTYPKANASKGSSDSPTERVGDGRTTASVLVRSDPPRSHDTGDSDVNRVLNDLMCEKEGKKEEEHDSIVGAGTILSIGITGVGGGILFHGTGHGQGPENGPPTRQNREKVGNGCNAKVGLDGNNCGGHIDGRKWNSTPQGIGNGTNERMFRVGSRPR